MSLKASGTVLWPSNTPSMVSKHTRASVGPGRSRRSQRLLSKTYVVSFSEESVKYGVHMYEPARRGIGSATDLASTEHLPGPRQSLPESKQCVPESLAPSEVLFEELVAVPACERHSELRSFFDELSSDLKTDDRGSLDAVLTTHAQKAPRARRCPRNVVPIEADDSGTYPLFEVPELPRTITPRPHLPRYRPAQILPHDEWLLNPLPSADVAQRLRSADAILQQQAPAWSDQLEDKEWSPQRLVPLLKTLTASKYHGNAFELVLFICSHHSPSLADLDLTRRPMTRLLEEWSSCAASSPTAVLLVKACIDIHKTQPPCSQESALENSGKRVDSRVMRLGLAAASLIGDVASSRYFFDYLAKTPNSTDGQAFGLLMAAHGQAGEWREATQLLTQMQSSGIMPTVKTYTTLIKACTAAGAPNRAVELFSEMESDGVAADLLAYNSLMGAFSRCGEWERAWSVLGAMRRAAVDPDIVSYNTLLKACERAGEWPRVVEVYNRLMRECDEGSGRLRPNVITFNTLISAAGNATEWEHALQFAEEMQEWDLQPDKVTMSSLVSALERAGQWQLAISKFDELVRMGIRPNVICYNAAISALAKGSQAEAAKELVADMQRKGLSPDIYTYAPLVGALGGAGRVEEAMQVWDDMRAAGVEPNSYVYVALINACERSSDWRRALKVFDTMKDSGVEMNTLSLAARQILYHWPQVLEQLPPAIVAAARAAVDTGRAARYSVHQALKDIPTQL